MCLEDSIFIKYFYSDAITLTVIFSKAAPSKELEKAGLAIIDTRTKGYKFHISIIESLVNV